MMARQPPVPNLIMVFPSLSNLTHLDFNKGYSPRLLNRDMACRFAVPWDPRHGLLTPGDTGE